MFDFLGRPKGVAALTSASAFAILASVSTAAAQEQQRTFDIRAQALTSALLEFSRQADVPVATAPNVADGLQAPSLVGVFTVSEALDRLLAGSGLIHTRTASGAILVSDPRVPTQLGANDAPSEDAGIVVTGTMIRGVAPVGTNVIGMSREDIVATGSTSANGVLVRIPQVTSAFLATPTTPSSDAGLSLIRPNIRDLGASGTNTTLVLVDGHRVVGAGILQTTADPDVIPPGVLERVEVMPDGGSSIYGSDAIGGVINFITRRRFEGLEASAHYGFAEDHETFDINLTAGADWGSGGAYVSYVYAESDAILGRDRDFMQQVTPNSPYCAPGTINANATTYAVGSTTPGTTSVCDTTDNASLWPDVERQSVFASLSQDLTDAVSLDVRGYFTRRDLTSYRDLAASQTQDMTITNVNPFFDPVVAETSQVINTSFAGVFDNGIHNRLDSFGITPILTADLGGDWQLRLMGNYGRSTTTASMSIVDTAARDAALLSANPNTALNPYDLGATNQTVLDDIFGLQVESSTQELQNARAIFEGPLFTLPGGDVRLAIGAEYTDESARIDAVGGAGSSSRDVQSFFAEVNVPLVGEGNEIPGVHRLTLTASVRQDDYSDAGDTTNPKLGLSYEPVDWVTVRANMGSSFNAPSLIDNTGNTVVVTIPLAPVPGQTAPWSAILVGNPGGLRPQTADTYSVGVDVEPPFIPGLSLSATYYNIDMSDVIGLLAGSSVGFSPATSAFLQDNLTCADPLISSLFALPQGGVPTAFVCGVINPPIAYVDWRVQNLGQIQQDGVDFAVNYVRPVSFGAIHAGLSGAYTLNRDVALVAGEPFVDRLSKPGSSRFFLSASAGATVGALSGTATVNYREGYNLDPDVTTARFGTQSEVDSFTTVDLFFNYDLPVHFGEETSLTLNVSNLFDEDPPFYNGAIGLALGGFTNGSTLGRLVTFGLRSKF